MKHTLLIITALMLIVGCGSDSILDINNLIDRGGLMYAPNDVEPFTGIVFDFYENGEKELDGNYRKGLMNGEWTYYHENGQIREQGRFIDGDGSTPDGVYPDWMADSLISILPPFDGRSGKWTYWYGDGQKRSEGTYKDGKWDGLLTEWYETGQKERETTYKDGEYDGLYTGWYDNGQKFWEDTYKDGELISSKCWDVNGIDIDCPW